LVRSVSLYLYVPQWHADINGSFFSPAAVAAFVNRRTAARLARRNQIETMETNQLLALAIAAAPATNSIAI
jgi:hypothetical protein